MLLALQSFTYNIYMNFRCQSDVVITAQSTFKCTVAHNYKSFHRMVFVDNKSEERHNNCGGRTTKTAK